MKFKLHHIRYQTSAENELINMISIYIVKTKFCCIFNISTSARIIQEALETNNGKENKHTVKTRCVSILMINGN